METDKQREESVSKPRRGAPGEGPGGEGPEGRGLGRGLRGGA